MNFLGSIITLFCSLFVVAAPRRYALIGVLAAVCYITQGQVVDVGGFHFTAIRMVLLLGMIRAVARGEFKAMEFNAIDKGVLWFVLISSVIFIVREESGSALVAQLGIVYNILLPYFFIRCLFRNREEIEEFIPALAITILPFAALMMLESLNGRNLFSVFGGIGEQDEFRNGHYRCSGAFRSPITGGTFGATLMPLFVGFYLTGRRRPFAVLGILAATVITISSRSSGPLLAFGSGVIALVFWRWREQMKRVRWGILLTIVFLHLVMKAPVWFLMGRVSDVVGGGGYHRAEIIDETVKHFRDWCLMGTDETGDWMPTQLINGGADLTNEFVVHGVHAGLISMLLFIWIIVLCYRHLGLAMRQLRGHFPENEKLLWAMGSALFATIVNFFSVSYFDQIQVMWFLLLAIISSSAFGVLSARSMGDEAPENMMDNGADLAVQSST